MSSILESLITSWVGVMGVSFGVLYLIRCGFILFSEKVEALNKKELIKKEIVFIGIALSYIISFITELIMRY